jgi:uncharacterized protein YndB with AHSA1/START domain
MSEEASGTAKSKRERRFEREMEIDAPPGEVWKALTDPEELTRWFPLKARVTPGEGGKIFLSWGPDCEGEARIVTWAPGRRLAWQEKWQEQVVQVEWTLEALGGKTILRLAQSGFAGESYWENEWFESTSFGWGLMLLGLQWALERHPGLERQIAWPRVKVSCSREEAYRRLVGAGGLFAENAAAVLLPGQEYALRTAAGEKWSGAVAFVQPPRGFCVSVREMNDALLWLTIEGAPGKEEAQLWLSAFGIAPSEVLEFENEWKHRLESLFAARASKETRN